MTHPEGVIWFLSVVLRRDDLNSLAPAEIRDFLAQVEISLEKLSPKERRCLQLRFGLVDQRMRTLEEVGAEFNFSRERARQVIAKAVLKVRHAAKANE